MILATWTFDCLKPLPAASQELPLITPSIQPQPSIMPVNPKLPLLDYLLKLAAAISQPHLNAASNKTRLGLKCQTPALGRKNLWVKKNLWFKI